MDSRNHTNIVENIPIFTSLTPDQLDDISKKLLLRRYKKDMFIYLEGEPAEAIYFVVEGLVKVYKTVADGKEQTIDIMRPGDVMGVVSFFDKQGYPATTQALEESLLAVLRFEDLTSILNEYPNVSIHLLETLSERLRRAQNKVTQMALDSSQCRVAKTLLELSKRHGIRTPLGYRMDLSITHQELANLAGLTRETVSRVLRSFREDGLILIDKRGITILAIERFEECY